MLCGRWTKKAERSAYDILIVNLKPQNSKVDSDSANYHFVLNNKSK